ncbi:MAG TPA: PadR family transcriptional regulator [Nocardioides sp.]|jgi:DNA-binding PadR family transcriptional regulator|uniref:PadR family transcriptional regulator n=1 Tax=Nocardioides sp. TaxID=35761 RepID=UPI002B723451|nr:PadR family transcriptional regulator [Nocardioides sp.]HTW17355.1 PadR family transcriptional regulator [Nocardioides sp.]
MTLATVLMGVLASGPAHGYDIKRVHDERFPASKKLAFGQVYATLGRLERDGLVESVETSQDGGPERTVYALTAKGEWHLRDWLASTEPAGPYVADELVRKTVTAVHTGADAVDFLRRQRAVHLDAMRALVRERERSTSVGERIAVDHALMHLDADVRWLDEARERVANHDTRSHR